MAIFYNKKEEEEEEEEEACRVILVDNVDTIQVRCGDTNIDSSNVTSNKFTPTKVESIFGNFLVGRLTVNCGQQQIHLSPMAQHIIPGVTELIEQSPDWEITYDTNGGCNIILGRASPKISFGRNGAKLLLYNKYTGKTLSEDDQKALCDFANGIKISTGDQDSYHYLVLQKNLKSATCASTQISATIFIANTFPETEAVRLLVNNVEVFVNHPSNELSGDYDFRLKNLEISMRWGGINAHSRYSGIPAASLFLKYNNTLVYIGEVHPSVNLSSPPAEPKFTFYSPPKKGKYWEDVTNKLIKYLQNLKVQIEKQMKKDKSLQNEDILYLYLDNSQNSSQSRRAVVSPKNELNRLDKRTEYVNGA